MRAVRVHTDEGQFVAVLGKPGRIYTPYVMIDFPIRKRRMPNGDVKSYATTLMKGKKEYPVKKAAKEMLRIGRTNPKGMTGGAKKLLREAVA